MPVCDKCDGVITRVTSLSGIFLTLMFFALLQRDLFLGTQSLVEGFFKQNLCHSCHTRFAVVSPLSSCCISSLILPITLPHALLNLTLTKKLLENSKIMASCPKNILLKHCIKHYIQQKWTLKNCQVLKSFQKKPQFQSILIFFKFVRPGLFLYLLSYLIVAYHF